MGDRYGASTEKSGIPNFKSREMMQKKDDVLDF